MTMKQLRIKSSRGIQPTSKNIGTIGEISNLIPLNHTGIYLHGEAMIKAGYDVVSIIDGNVNNMFAPIIDQSILLLIGDDTYECKCIKHTNFNDRWTIYYISLSEEIGDILLDEIEVWSNMYNKATAIK